MPTADPFNAAGRRNGLPFTLVAATDSAINAVDGNAFDGIPVALEISGTVLAFGWRL